MLAVKGIFDEGKIEFLDPVPTDRRSMVAVVFLDVGQEEVEDATEALLLSQSPTFRRLVDRSLSEIEKGSSQPIQSLLMEVRAELDSE
jgi:hypothetical protein